MSTLTRLTKQILGVHMLVKGFSTIQNTNVLPTNSAFAVVIGGGVVGTSIAYHLTRRNFRDVVILEKGAITSSETVHSPGIVSSAHPAHRYKPILSWSVELYSQLKDETGVDVNFSQPGTIRLATNEKRLNEFRRYVARDYFVEGDVCRTTLIDADEVKRIASIVDTSKVLSALYTTNDGYIDPHALALALSKGAQNRGASIIEHCPSFTLNEQPHGDWIVKFDDGQEIRALHIVNAAGPWAVEIAKKTGLNLPLVFLEHQYGSIGPVSEIGVIESLPTIIDHDTSFYLRKYGDHLFWGGFEQEASDVFVKEKYEEELWKDRTVELHFERIQNNYERACELIPCLRGATVDKRARMASMTADGYPLVGPTNERQNYWLQVGHFDGLSSGGGIGRYLADWIVDGEPPHELFDTDATRFNRWADSKFVVSKSRESYSMFYKWSDDNRMAGRPTQRISGIYSRLAKGGGVHIFRNGWEVASRFPVKDEGCIPTMIREYQLVTNKCGVTDLSWKSKIEIRGPDSTEFLHHVLSNQVPRLGSISSALMLTSKGNIMAPLKVIHHDRFRTEFILLSDPERESRDINWLKRMAAYRRYNVEILPVSDYLASIALVGPCSREVLQDLTITDVSNESFGERTTKLIRIHNVPVIAARTSTVMGQLSYEFFHSRADTLKLYNAIRESGERYGIVNFGLATHNVLRLENGFKLWGREITLDTNPFECDLMHVVDLTKKEFVGRTALLQMENQQWSKRLVLITCDPLDNLNDLGKVPTGMETIRRRGEERRIGQVTSGTYSVRLNRPLLYAWVNSDIATEDELVIDTGRFMVTGHILEAPPLKRIS